MTTLVRMRNTFHPQPALESGMQWRRLPRRCNYRFPLVSTIPHNLPEVFHHMLPSPEWSPSAYSARGCNSLIPPKVLATHPPGIPPKPPHPAVACKPLKIRFYRFHSRLFRNIISDTHTRYGVGSSLHGSTRACPANQCNNGSIKICKL